MQSTYNVKGRTDEGFASSCFVIRPISLPLFTHVHQTNPLGTPLLYSLADTVRVYPFTSKSPGNYASTTSLRVILPPIKPFQLFTRSLG